MFQAAQELLDERGKRAKEGMKYSCKYWFSNKVVCGKCGTHYSKTGGKNTNNPMLHCSNRASYGTEHRISAYGRPVGCDNIFMVENILKTCVRYVLAYVREEREQIEKQLLADIREIQKRAKKVDAAPLKAKIEKTYAKKQNAVDLMLEGIISKEDLKRQVEQYDAEIRELTTQIENGKNMRNTHDRQLDAIREYIAQIKATEDMDIDSTEVYGEVVREMVVYDDCRLDVYLHCVPFGFRLHYIKGKKPFGGMQIITVDDCTTI